MKKTLTILLVLYSTILLGSIDSLKQFVFNKVSYNVFPKTLLEKYNYTYSKPTLEWSVDDGIEYEDLLPPPIINKLSDGNYILLLSEKRIYKKDTFERVLMTFEIKDNAYNGKFIVYDAWQNKPIIKGFLKNGEKDSTWTSFDGDGIIQARFKGNLLQGWQIHYGIDKSWKRKVVKWENNQWNPVIKKRRFVDEIDSIFYENGKKEGIRTMRLKNEVTNIYTYHNDIAYQRINYIGYPNHFLEFLPRGTRFFDTLSWIRTDLAEDAKYRNCEFVVLRNHKRLYDYTYNELKSGKRINPHRTENLIYSDTAFSNYSGAGSDYLKNFYWISWDNFNDTLTIFRRLTGRDHLRIPWSEYAVEVNYYLGESIYKKKYINGQAVIQSAIKVGPYEQYSEVIKKGDELLVKDSIIVKEYIYIDYSKYLMSGFLVDVGRFSVSRHKWTWVKSNELYGLRDTKEEWILLESSVMERFPKYDYKYGISWGGFKSTFRQYSRNAEKLRNGLIIKTWKHQSTGFVYSQYILKKGKNNFIPLNKAEFSRKDTSVIKITSFFDKKQKTKLTENIYLGDSNFNEEWAWKRSLSHHLFDFESDLNPFQLSDSIKRIQLEYAGKELSYSTFEIHDKNYRVHKKFKSKTRLTYKDKNKDLPFIKVKTNLYSYFSKNPNQTILKEEYRFLQYHISHYSASITQQRRLGSEYKILSNWSVEYQYNGKKYGEYSTDNNNSIVSAYYNNGKIENYVFYGGNNKKQLEFKNGLPNGKFIEFNRENEIQSMVQVKQGLPHGKYFHFSNDDTLCLIDFVEGKVHGLCIDYIPVFGFKIDSTLHTINGIDSWVFKLKTIIDKRKHSELIVKNGYCDSAIIFHSNGYKKLVVTILDSFIPFQYFYNHDKSKKVASYLNRKGCDLGNMYYLTEKKVYNNVNSFSILETHYQPESFVQFQSKWRTYYLNGIISSQGNYKNCKKDSIWNYYMNNGSLFQQIDFYKNDTIVDNLNLTGGITCYQPNGKPYYKGFIISYDDVFDCNQDIKVEIPLPLIKQFYDTLGNEIKLDSQWLQILNIDGSVHAKGFMVDGKPDGVWQFFGNGGILRSFGRFEKGIKQDLWLSGDLTGVHIYKDACFNKNYLKNIKLSKDINLERIFYKDGIIMENTKYYLTE